MSEDEEKVIFKGDLLKIGSALVSMMLCTYYIGGKVEVITTTLKTNTESIAKHELLLQEHTTQISTSKQDIRELQLYRELSLPSKTK